MNPDECPSCFGVDSRVEITDRMSDVIEEVRSCNACGTEFVNRYSIVEQEVIRND